MIYEFQKKCKERAEYLYKLFLKNNHESILYIDGDASLYIKNDYMTLEIVYSSDFVYEINMPINLFDALDDDVLEWWECYCINKAYIKTFHRLKNHFFKFIGSDIDLCLLHHVIKDLDVSKVYSYNERLDYLKKKYEEFYHIKIDDKFVYTNID